MAGMKSGETVRRQIVILQGSALRKSCVENKKMTVSYMSSLHVFCLTFC